MNIHQVFKVASPPQKSFYTSQPLKCFRCLFGKQRHLAIPQGADVSTVIV